MTTNKFIDPYQISNIANGYLLIIHKTDEINIDQIEFDFDNEGIYVAALNYKYPILSGKFIQGMELISAEYKKEDNAVKITLNTGNAPKVYPFLNNKWKNYDMDPSTFAQYISYQFFTAKTIRNLSELRQLIKQTVDTRWVKAIAFLGLAFIRNPEVYDIFFEILPKLIAYDPMLTIAKLILSFMYLKCNINGDEIIEYLLPHAQWPEAKHILGVVLSPLSQIECKKNLKQSVIFLSTVLQHKGTTAYYEAVYEFCSLLYNGVGMKKDEKLALELVEEHLPKDFPNRKLRKYNTTAFGAVTKTFLRGALAFAAFWGIYYFQNYELDFD